MKLKLQISFLPTEDELKTLTEAKSLMTEWRPIIDSVIHNAEDAVCNDMINVTQSIHDNICKLLDLCLLDNKQGETDILLTETISTDSSEKEEEKKEEETERGETEQEETAEETEEDIFQKNLKAIEEGFCEEPFDANDIYEVLNRHERYEVATAQYPLRYSTPPTEKKEELHKTMKQIEEKYAEVIYRRLVIGGTTHLYLERGLDRKGDSCNAPLTLESVRAAIDSRYA